MTGGRRLEWSQVIVQRDQMIQEVDACRASLGRECWFGLGRRFRVDDVVVDRGLAEAGAPCDFERVWARGALAVWRRAGECPARS